MGNEIFSNSEFRRVIKFQRSQLIAHNPEGLITNDTCGNSTIEEIYSWCHCYCSQGPALAVLFLCSLTPYLKGVLDTACAVNGYIVGLSGVGKTEFIKLLARLTTSHCGISLESDKREIMQFFEKFGHDRGFLVDDLNIYMKIDCSARE